MPGFLFGVTTGQVRPELIDKIDRYRADCFRVLWEAFRGDVTSAMTACFAEVRDRLHGWYREVTGDG